MEFTKDDLLVNVKAEVIAELQDKLVAVGKKHPTPEKIVEVALNIMRSEVEQYTIEYNKSKASSLSSSSL